MSLWRELRTALGGPTFYYLLLACSVSLGIGCRSDDEATLQAMSGAHTNHTDSSLEDVAETVTAVSTQWDDAVEEVRSGAEDRIRISDAPVTAQQLKVLAEVTEGRLVDLLLDEGIVPVDLDEAIDAIATCPSIQHLRIRRCPVNDLQLKRLAKQLGELEILNLPQANLTAAGLEYLTNLVALKQLRLGGGSLDDACVEKLIGIPKLKSLHLIGPKLTSRSLVSLAQAPSLASFYLDDCPLEDDASEEAWKKLFLAKPNIHVHVDQQHRDRDPNRHEHQ